jgi:WD40 repeat protein
LLNRNGKEEIRLEIPVTKNYWGGIVALAPDGKTVAATVNQSELRLWDTASKKEKRIIKLPALTDQSKRHEEIASIYFGPAGKTLYVGTNGHGIRRYDLGSEKELPPLRGHAWSVMGLHAAEDGKTLVSTSWDSTIRRWDLATGKELPLPEGYVWRVTSAFSPDGKRVAVADLGSGRLDLWDAGTGKIVSNLQKAGPGIVKIAFSKDGKSLALGCFDGVIRIWDVLTGKQTKTLAIPEQQPQPAWQFMNLVLFSPDGTKLLTTGAGEDGLRLWDVATGKLIWSIKVTDNSQAAFSPDGRILVAGGWSLSFRDLATGQEQRGVSVEPDPKQSGLTVINSLSFSPDGKILATTHLDGLIRFWDAVSASEIRKLRGHDGAVWTVRFSPNGKWAVSGATDNTIRVWDVLTGKEVLKLGQDAWVRHVEFSPNGKTILASGSTEALLWDARPRQPLGHDLASLWEDLHSPDPAKAYWAMWSFSALDKEAASFLEKQIEPVKAEDPKHLAKLIADLDSDQFATRDAAAKALSKLGDRAETALREAVKKPSSSEAERQIKRLLNDLDQGPSPEDLRRSHAVEALELAGTPEARRVLSAWAKGAPGARLTEDAKAASERSKKN